VRLCMERHPYGVSCTVEDASPVGRLLLVRGHLFPYDGDDIAAIVGDVVFNTRSALDHLCVALTGNESAQFPIFTTNVDQAEIDPTTGKDRNAPGRKRFKEWTKGMITPAFKHVRAVQPWATNPSNPDQDFLAVLNRLSNLDKHRRLLVISRYLYNVSTTYFPPGDSPSTISNPAQVVIDGGLIAEFLMAGPDPDPRVEAEGGFEIGLKEADGQAWDLKLPDSLFGIVRYVEDEVITPLDALVAG